ncbi:unnamed protein product [Arabidopsis halleri]
MRELSLHLKCLHHHPSDPILILCRLHIFYLLNKKI